MKTFILCIVIAVGVFVGFNNFKNDSYLNKNIRNQASPSEAEVGATISTNNDESLDQVFSQAEGNEVTSYQLDNFSGSEPMDEDVNFDSETMTDDQKKLAREAADLAIEEGLIDQNDREDFELQFQSHNRSVAQHEYEIMTE